MHPISSDITMAVAWLHDTIEDVSWVTRELIEQEFGPEVADMVQQLTNPSKGSPLSRKNRKAMDIAHLASVSHEAQIIKLLDRIEFPESEISKT